MVDQAHECLRYLRKNLTFRVLNTEKLNRSVIFLLIVISDMKLGVLLAIYHSNNEIFLSYFFLLTCLAMES